MYYFAYGANMSQPHMAELCPAARLAGVGEARGWEFHIMSSGFGSIRPELTKSVHGLIWEVSAQDISELDWYEDIDEGLYRKEVVDIAGPGGAVFACTVYIGNDAADGAPLPGYLESIIRHARQQGLPKAYIGELESWLVE